MGNASTEPDKDAGASEFQVTQIQANEADKRAFAPTEITEDPNVAANWWSECTDGQCSETAALFAASQPAPLSVV